jgi:hypothetical protein
VGKFVLNAEQPELGVESQFDDLVGIVRCGFPLPLAQGVFGGLHENGMAAFYLDPLDLATGLNQHVRANASLNPHGAGERWILRDHLGQDFAVGIVDVLGAGVAGTECEKQEKSDKCKCEPVSHGDQSGDSSQQEQDKRDLILFEDHKGNGPIVTQGG